MANEQVRCSDKDYAELLQQRHEVELRVVSRACEDDAFRKKLLSNPKAALQDELGVELPAELTVNVHEETPTTGYLRIPAAPKRVEMSEELSEDALEGVAGGGVILAYEDANQATGLVAVKTRKQGGCWGLIIW